jgi:alcohol dehydrogenase class IV
MAFAFPGGPHRVERLAENPTGAKSLMKRTIVVIGVALGLLVSGTTLPVARAFAQDQNIEQMIENAKTPADYEAIAAYYDKQADEAQKQLDWHEKLYKTYKQNPRLSTLQMHCHRLIRLYKEQLKEDRVTADQYRQMAKKAQ